MKYQLKNVASGDITTSTELPRWFKGAWEVDDLRITDPSGLEFELLPYYPALSAMDFYLAFAPQERVAIKASTDPMVVEFWATYQLAVTTGSLIHPELPSVQGALAYLRALGVLTSDDRIHAILTGIAQ